MYLMWHLLYSALVALTFPVTSIFGRRKPREPAKCLREGARFAKTDLDSDLGHREFRHLQQAPGAIHPAGHMVTMRRHAEGLGEGARKMVKAEIDKLGESGQRNLLREVLLDEFDDAPLLPRRQAATNRSRCSGCRSFQSDQFVH